MSSPETVPEQTEANAVAVRNLSLGVSSFEYQTCRKDGVPCFLCRRTFGEACAGTSRDEGSRSFVNVDVPLDHTTEDERSAKKSSKSPSSETCDLNPPFNKDDDFSVATSELNKFPGSVEGQAVLISCEQDPLLSLPVDDSAPNADKEDESCASAASSSCQYSGEASTSSQSRKREGSRKEDSEPAEICGTECEPTTSLSVLQEEGSSGPVKTGSMHAPTEDRSDCESELLDHSDGDSIALRAQRPGQAASPVACAPKSGPYKLFGHARPAKFGRKAGEKDTTGRTKCSFPNLLGDLKKRVLRIKGVPYLKLIGRRRYVDLKALVVCVELYVPLKLVDSLPAQVIQQKLK